jgi:hypothetical protein
MLLVVMEMLPKATVSLRVLVPDTKRQTVTASPDFGISVKAILLPFLVHL